MFSSAERSGRDSFLLDLEVPCVCNYADYCMRPGSFLDIPESHGLHWDTVHCTKSSSLNTTEKAASFLQGWLFFALLNRVSFQFNVKFKAKEFVTETPSPYIGSTPPSSTLVSGRELHKYIWLWTGAMHHKTLDEQRGCVTAIKTFIDILQKVTNAWLEQDDVPITSTFDRILLSLTLLGESLVFAMSEIFRSGVGIETFKTPYRWNCSGHIYQRLIKVGWCEGEVPLLLERCQPTILLYLSSIERMRQDKDHSKCDSMKGCLVNQLDPKKYRPSHAADCPDKIACIMLSTSVREVSNLILTGYIPLVTVTSDKLGTTTLQIHSFKLDKKDRVPSYVAISHVWSDGMGNPRVNGVQSCQLRQIQTAVDALYDLHPGHQVEDGKPIRLVPFWMDTLCVPLQSYARSTAIARMAKTFLHAEQVLVMDNWLRQHRSDAHARETLIRIAHSDWNTRLWTFQEAILAPKCYFQLKDRAMSMDELKDTPQTSDNLQKVSEILSTIDREEILREESTMNLLRALTSVDQRTVETIDEYSSLPPQPDPDKELLRLHAIEQREKLRLASKSLRTWAPLLAKADIQDETDQTAPPNNARKIDLAENLRAHIETRIFDPFLSHGLDALFRIRGFIYGSQASRFQDLAGGARRQLTAFTSSPADILRDASRGLPGRTTSILEDETICLGGIIGLDISSILGISVNESKRGQHGVIELICADRMKKFLSQVKTLPASVLFWNTTRMQDYPWRWASRSFLERNACKAVFSTDSAEVTEHGLMAHYRGISIKLNRFSAFQKRFRTLRLQYVDPETENTLEFDNLSEYQQKWMCLELLEPSSTKQKTSWYDLFTEARDIPLALVTFTQQKLDGVLVSILREEQGVLITKYLANVVLVSGDDEPEYLESYVDAAMMGWKKWCVG